MSYLSILKKGLNLEDAEIVNEPSTAEEVMPASVVDYSKSTLISLEQLTHWTHLHKLVSESPLSELVNVLESGQAIALELIPVEMWIMLEQIYNDAFYWFDFAQNPVARVSIKDLNLHSVMHPIIGSLCSVHAPTEWHKLKAPIAILNNVRVGELPTELHPDLTLLLSWYEYVQGMYSYRLFSVVYDVDKEDKFQVELRPQLVGSHMNLRTQLILENEKLVAMKKNHLVCLYCFPTPLGIALHSLQREYEPISKNIPRDMRVAVLGMPIETTDDLLLRLQSVLLETNRNVLYAYKSIVYKLAASDKSLSEMDLMETINYLSKFYHGLHCVGVVC